MNRGMNERDLDVIGKEDRILLLREAARQAWLDGDHEWMQELNWTLNWLRSGSMEPEPPAQWSADNVRHRDAAQRVVDEFLAMATAATPYQGCLYRPTAELPYGRPQIEASLRLVFAAAVQRNALLDALGMLHGFVDVPAAELPTEPAANLTYVHGRSDDPLAA
jgi:hypothetical protein